MKIMVLEVRKFRFNTHGRRGLDVSKDDETGHGQVMIFNGRNSITIPADEWRLIEDNLRNNLPSYILHPSSSQRRDLKKHENQVISDTWMVRIQICIPTFCKRRALVIYEKLPWLPEVDIRFNEVSLNRQDAQKLLAYLPEVTTFLNTLSGRETTASPPKTAGGTTVTTGNY